MIYRPSKSLFFLLYFLIALLTLSAPSFAEDKAKDKDLTLLKSTILDQSGTVQVGKKFPFFAAWTVGDQSPTIQNISKILKKYPAKRYVIMMCSSVCKPCMKGLKEIVPIKEKFKETQTQLIVFVAEFY